MKYLAIFVALLMVIACLDTTLARSEPVCGYTNSKGEMIFLRYATFAKEGQSYTETGADGKCIKVTCQADYTLKNEEC